MFKKNLLKNFSTYLIFSLVLGQFPVSSSEIRKITFLNHINADKIEDKSNNKHFNVYLSENIESKNEKYEEESLQIENFVDELYNSNNEGLKIPIIDFEESKVDNLNILEKDLKDKKILKKRVNSTIDINILPETDLDIKKSLTTPKSGEISVGQFKIPSRGYVELNGPSVSLNLIKANAIETLKFIASLSGKGFMFLENNSDNNSENISSNNLEDLEILPITANFKDQDISSVFNSILMASNLQAKIEKNIIFVGKDIFNKTINSKFSKTYRMNQANAGSIADYLSTLGAKISKVLVRSAAVTGDEVGGGDVDKIELNESYINSYGMLGGPLNGLIGTVDLRLQTITLIGSEELIATAEKYIKPMDARHRQVALAIKIIDVSLTKTDLKNNAFELRTGNTYLYSSEGMGLMTGNTFEPLSNPSVASNIANAALPGGNFMNWLFAKIKNENAKVMASPTLILGENSDPNLSGAAAVDDALGSATIGRPFSNEGFIKVGETVVVNYDKTVEDGVTTCTPSSGTSGITFGAKVDKIDDNGFVTFALSPAISSVTRTQEITGCGIQSILSVRKLDTGSIRVRDGDTLVLTGVLKDEDNVTTSKAPLLGDIPFLGKLFRQNSMSKRKSELIILVTPKIIKEDYS